MQKYIIISSMVSLVIGLEFGYFWGQRITAHHIYSSIANKEEINQLLDNNYLEGLYAGGRCVLLSESEQKTDLICVDSEERIMKMK